MLAILLMILKIIGIVLLSLLGLLLLIILVVLFVPIRYCITAYKNEEQNDNYNVTAKFSFLLHLINGRFVFPADEKLRIRIGLFTIIPKKEKPIKTPKEKKSKNKEITVRDEDTTPEHYEETDKAKEESSGSDFDQKAETVRQIANEINEQATDDNPTIRKFIDKIIDFAKNFKNKIISFINKIRDVRDNIEYYIELINSDLFKKSYSLCKKELIRLLNSIKPRKLKGIVHFGNENPETAGMVFGLYSTVYPVIGGNIAFIPHFEDKVFTADLYLKGRITLFIVLVVAIKIYFNKDIKHTLDLLKREK